MSSPRRWFTPEVCEGTSRWDCSVMNVAARRLVDLHDMPPTLRNLMDVRCEYKRGMSSDMVIDAVLKVRAARTA